MCMFWVVSYAHTHCICARVSVLDTERGDFQVQRERKRENSQKLWTLTLLTVSPSIASLTAALTRQHITAIVSIPAVTALSTVYTPVAGVTGWTRHVGTCKDTLAYHVMLLSIWSNVMSEFCHDLSQYVMLSHHVTSRDMFMLSIIRFS